jgi:hypothetical protein
LKKKKKIYTLIQELSEEHESKWACRRSGLPSKDKRKLAAAIPGQTFLLLLRETDLELFDYSRDKNERQAIGYWIGNFKIKCFLIKIIDPEIGTIEFLSQDKVLELLKSIGDSNESSKAGTE